MYEPARQKSSGSPEGILKHFSTAKIQAPTARKARHILIPGYAKAGKMTGLSRPLLQIGEWIADPHTDSISRGSESQKLEPRTMRLLLLLADAPGVVISVDRMLAEVWTGVIVGSASVYQAISQLRRLLGDTDPEPTYIATVPRKGYRLVAAVRPWTPAAAPFPPPAVSAAVSPVASPASPASAPPSARRVRRRRVLAAAGVSALIVAMVLAWPVLQRRLAAAQPAAPPSIVVLPFIDMTDDKKDQSFCDGLTEELSNWLAQIPTLRVVARTSAFAYRDRSVDVRTIGKELGTTHVLEGSLRRSGNQMRITAQLISTRDGYHIWSADFDRPVGDVVKVQEEIARSVADNLEIRLTEQTGERFAARREGSSQAYQLYLLARHHQQSLTRDSNDHAIDLYKQALALDPDFALAYAGLASAYLNQRYLNDVSVRDVADKAESLIATAVRLDPLLPEVFRIRGALRSDQGRNEEALRDLQRAIELNPNDGPALTEMGYLYIYNARPREALASYSAALALDPLNFNLHARRCIALTDMARLDEADRACAHARALGPDVSWPYVASSWLDWERGRLDDALKWNALAVRLSPNEFDLDKDRSALLLTLGLTADARATLEQARTAANNADSIAVRLAQISYYEGGTSALRAQIGATGIAASTHADTLMLAAHLELLLDDAPTAKRMLDRALAAPDLNQNTLDHPWRERQGDSSELTMAIAELQTGDRAAAGQRLDALDKGLDRMLADGVERYGVYKLRAQVLALRGDADGAMQALRQAAGLGWRESIDAEHDPAFASLQSRSDFRSLIERTGKDNMRIRLKFSPSGA
jgi:transcriptional activator of cad operon